MNYRHIYDNKVSTLCFGTSMFVSGKIRPDADSQVGKKALANSLNSGINLIHSNFKLKTSWAIREVLQGVSNENQPFHLVKIELPLTSNFGDLKRQFIEKLENSVNDLKIDSVFAIMYEIDNKRSQVELYSSNKIVFENFVAIKAIFDEIKNAYNVKYLFHNTKTKREIALSLEFDQFNGYSSYFNLVDTWILPYLDKIYKSGKVYLAMAPYKKGELVGNRFSDSDFDIEEVNKRLAILHDIGFDTYPIQKFILRYVLSHPVVKTVIIGITRPDYLSEIIDASSNPYSIDEFNKINEILSF